MYKKYPICISSGLYSVLKRIDTTFIIWREELLRYRTVYTYITFLPYLAMKTIADSAPDIFIPCTCMTFAVEHYHLEKRFHIKLSVLILITNMSSKFNHPRRVLQDYYKSLAKINLTCNKCMASQ